jgi:hypothetical protein
MPRPLAARASHEEKEREMFGRKKGPDKAFSHADDCKIAKVDPDVKIEWSEIRRGVWEAVCVCGKQYSYEPADSRTRLDPLDPSTSRHMPQCEHRDTTDPETLRFILDVKDGLEPGYWWVTCRACATSWQVLHFAAESVR